MTKEKIRPILFVLLTSVFIVILITALKIGKTEIKDAPLLFTASLIGLIVVISIQESIQETEEHGYEWIGIAAISIIGFLILPIIQQSLALPNLLAFLFAAMLALPILLIKMRERIFTKIAN